MQQTRKVRKIKNLWRASGKALSLKKMTLPKPAVLFFHTRIVTDSIIEIAAQLPDLLEMHDALIVATSLHYNAHLITKDKIIIQTASVKTLW